MKSKSEGNFRRVLCVCSAGILRSATIAWVLSNEPYRCNTRAVGLGDYALIRVTPQLLQWADEIVCADKEQVDASTRMTDKPVHCLHIPDQYEFRSPELVSAIETALKLCDVFSQRPTEIKSCRCYENAGITINSCILRRRIRIRPLRFEYTVATHLYAFKNS
jgi:predicted protein tyrosine phosphatase